MRIAGLVVVGCCWLVHDRCRADVKYTITSLAAVADGDGARAVNNNGVVAMRIFGEVHYWQGGTVTPVPNLVATPLAMNDLGHLAGGRSGRGFIYRNNVISDIGSLEPGGYTWATGINATDVIVGTSFRSAPTSHARAFKWVNGVMTELPGLGPNGTYPQDHESFGLGMNNLGDVVGEYSPSLNIGTPAVMWRNNAIITLPTPPGFDRGGATAINDSGLVVGYASFGVYRPYSVMWVNGVPTMLGSLPGRAESSPFAVNNSGVIVGKAWGPGGDPGHAFVWTQGAMQDLNSLISAPGWELHTAWDINDLGQIVGIGRLNGAWNNFLLTPVPTPGVGVVMAVGAMVAGRRRR